MPDRLLELDRDRVTVLLLINALLIKKAYNIYVTILSNQQTIQQMLPQARQGILDQYNNLNRRLQCNLSVLSYINDVYHNKPAAQQPNRLKFPVILSAPGEMPELKQLYKQLHDLYPEAIQYLKMKLQQMKQQQQQQQQQQQPEEFQRRQMESMQRPPQKQAPPQQFQQYQQYNSLHSSNNGLSQFQGKSMLPDTMFKDTGDFDDFQKPASMLISPQQILLQKSGSNDFPIGFF